MKILETHSRNLISHFAPQAKSKESRGSKKTHLISNNKVVQGAASQSALSFDQSKYIEISNHDLYKII